jgi:ribose transport system ATP-binding protein
LRVERLTGETVRNLSFTVCAREAVGVAGLTGSGREEVAGLLAGRLPRAGQVVVGGEILPPGSPRASTRAGVAYVPANRVGEALLVTATVRENITVGLLSPFWRKGKLHRKAEQQEVAHWAEKVNLSPRDPEAPILSLSGGNQQKVVLARCLRLSPSVLLLDEPTQGVDVGSKVEIHQSIRDVIDSGAGVVICSTDSDELARLCTKVVFLHRGEVVGTLTGSEVTSENIEDWQLRTSQNRQTTPSERTGEQS